MGHLLTKYGINSQGGAVIITASKTVSATASTGSTGGTASATISFGLPTGSVITSALLSVALAGDINSSSETIYWRFTGSASYTGTNYTGYQDTSYRNVVTNKQVLNTYLSPTATSASCYVDLASGVNALWSGFAGGGRFTLTLTYQYEQ